MVEVIDYPANKVKPDELPEPGDKYEAYGLAHKFKPPSLIFIFPDWSMAAFPYDAWSMGTVKILNDDGDSDGECSITLEFRSTLPGGGAIAVITGCRLHAFFSHLAYHRVHWLWTLPEGRAPADEGAPVIHSIEIANRRTLKATPPDPSA